MHRSRLPSDQPNGQDAPYRTDIVTVPEVGVNRTSVLQSVPGPVASRTTVPSSSGEPTSTDQPCASRPARIAALAVATSVGTANVPLVAPSPGSTEIWAGRVGKLGGRASQIVPNSVALVLGKAGVLAVGTVVAAVEADGPPGTAVGAGTAVATGEAAGVLEARAGLPSWSTRRGRGRATRTRRGAVEDEGDGDSAESRRDPRRAGGIAPGNTRPPSRPSTTAVSGRRTRSPDPRLGRHRSSRPMTPDRPEPPGLGRSVVQRRPPAWAASAGRTTRIRRSAMATMDPVRRVATSRRAESRFMAQ
jgi:hypothetical protein